MSITATLLHSPIACLFRRTSWRSGVVSDVQANRREVCLKPATWKVGSKSLGFGRVPIGIIGGGLALNTIRKHEAKRSLG
jgi:hypothetical protein